ncbi:hypothetical protein CHCC20488_1181 [Bacillus paralicheniformis]|uniref:Uncharacterized protein n=1 Tax=Bacillus paralicheniformis TaxID=1648923 RepID=A0ABY3FX14_9BACI|nr:hypothetical protein CHCC5023_1084 [Bacillus paralicheniformis]TWJ82126.1 hypothetical protein CHCC20497_4428 [Bacillus paralicheniformis]TWL40066.1 hypothetical protein CHCC15381_1438 [Bacillus paralicheniformis]TWN36626.1 hypothetical protein CHCC14523_4366 [Bacillus paralicheniformis]TWN84499.1 hypothetical protein CHCC20492_0249 [Bacillus paralicheniformis]
MFNADFCSASFSLAKTFSSYSYRFRLLFYSFPAIIQILFY